MGQSKNAVRTMRSVNPEISLAELHVAKLDNEMKRKDAFWEVARQNANDQIMILRRDLAKTTALAAERAMECGQLLEQRKENLERIEQLDQQARLACWAVDKVQAQRDIAIDALSGLVAAIGRDDTFVEAENAEAWRAAMDRANEVLSGADLATDLQHRLEMTAKALADCQVGKSEAVSALTQLFSVLDHAERELWNVSKYREAYDRARDVLGFPLIVQDAS